MSKNQSSHDLPASWPPEDSIDKLVQKAADAFIFASTICKVLEEGDPEDKLEQLVQIPTDQEGHLVIDDIYHQVVETALRRRMC